MWFNFGKYFQIPQCTFQFSLLIIGKTSWESTVDLKCKPIFELPILFEKPISFQLDELMSLKVPLIAVPEPNLVLEKLDKDDEAIVEATFTSNPSLDEPVHKGQHFVQPVSV